MDSAEDRAKLEQRLGRLEENDWFQEESLKTLDQRIQEQQKQLDTLERDLAALTSQLRGLRDFANILAADSGSASQETPPHYQSTAWHDKDV